ncbi:hypothetical protein Lalb_Chr06g0166821 [Lupinus albus]|uniref:Uncharacterized protein n=1 Tax=Lupinus albus TaxID=3870 RepID=A0A6A4QE08_LUPAL|nr:hypothetical protein Lalb_Chr06g0166821 [Lupinus albus]
MKPLIHHHFLSKPTFQPQKIRVELEEHKVGESRKLLNVIQEAVRKELKEKDEGT